MIPPNIRILSVERRDGQDRYGQPDYITVHKMIPACLERGQFTVQTDNGVQMTADASMLVSGIYPIRAEDRLSLDTERPERYTVFRSRESLTAGGTVEMRQLVLVKIQDED